MNAPKTDAPQELQFRLQVDRAHCEHAAQALRLMAHHQYRNLARRYENVGWLKWPRKGSRTLLAAMAAVAFVMALIECRATWTDGSSSPGDFGLPALLFIEAWVLWLLRGRLDWIRVRLRRRFERFFGDRATAMMRKAVRAAPFEAVYDLRGDLLAYSRIENGAWKPLWHRRLGKFQQRGVALQTPGLLAIFSKPGAVLPALVVLTGNDGAVAAAIRTLGWTIVDIDPTSGDPVAAGADSTAGEGARGNA